MYVNEEHLSLFQPNFTNTFTKSFCTYIQIHSFLLFLPLIFTSHCYEASNYLIVDLFFFSLLLLVRFDHRRFEKCYKQQKRTGRSRRKNFTEIHSLTSSISLLTCTMSADRQNIITPGVVNDLLDPYACSCLPTSYHYTICSKIKWSTLSITIALIIIVSKGKSIPTHFTRSSCRLFMLVVDCIL